MSDKSSAIRYLSSEVLLRDRMFLPGEHRVHLLNKKSRAPGAEEDPSLLQTYVLFYFQQPEEPLGFVFHFSVASGW